MANADGTQIRRIAKRKTGVNLDDYSGARWSPDGQRLLTVVTHSGDLGGLTSALDEVDPKSGTEIPIRGGGWRAINDFSWLPDGSGILLAAREKSAVPFQLWIVNYPDGRARRITNDLGDYLSASRVLGPEQSVREYDQLSDPGGQIHSAGFSANPR